tara:strand:- start:772 stop:951 length:180 start_codon:yes stop_codon:yes gene_type:complete
MPSGDLDSGNIKAEDLDAAFAPKAAPKAAPKKVEKPLGGLTAKQEKEIKAPTKPSKTNS